MKKKTDREKGEVLENDNDTKNVNVLDSSVTIETLRLDKNVKAKAKNKVKKI